MSRYRQCDLSEHPLFGQTHGHGDAIAVVRTEGDDAICEMDVCEECLSYLTSSLDFGVEMTIVRHEPIPCETPNAT